MVTFPAVLVTRDVVTSGAEVLLLDASSDGVVQIAAENPRVTVPNPAEANAVFPVLPESVTQELQQKYRFYVWDQVTGQVRWMCSWDTTEEDIDGFLETARGILHA